MTELSFSIIPDLNVNRFLFLDVSDYSSAPVAPTLFIKFPDFQKEYVVPISFGSINILNTKRIGYSSEVTEFPDGVYCLRFEVNNGSCEERLKYFRTTKAWRDLDAIFQEHDWSNNKDLLEKFSKISLYLRGAESVVKSNPEQATQLYLQATNIIKCLNPNVQLFKKQCSCS